MAATSLHEHDAMRCRSCGNEERASEGYPCASCGTFICLMCVFKGVVRCGACASDSAAEEVSPPTPVAPAPPFSAPEPSPPSSARPDGLHFLD